MRVAALETRYQQTELCEFGTEVYSPRETEGRGPWFRFSEGFDACFDVFDERWCFALLKACDEPFRLLIALGRSTEPNAMAADHNEVSDFPSHGRLMLFVASRSTDDERYKLSL